MDTADEHAGNDHPVGRTDAAHDGLHVEVVARPDATATLVRLTGELDVTTAPELRAAVGRVLRGPAPGTVEVDAGGLKFLDSSGIRCLLVCRKQAEAAGSLLVLTEVSPCVYQVLEITGLLDLFAVTPRGPSALPTGRRVPARGRGRMWDPQATELLIRQATALRQSARETRQRAEATRTDDALNRSQLHDRPSPK